MILFIVSLICALTAIFLFSYKKYLITGFFIFCSALFIRFHYISQDHYLHDFDEKYHALVAKNMMSKPLAPMLRTEPVLDYNYKDWSNNHIWLHKQPLFLWQMAISMKIFGVNEFGLRFPSAFLCACLTLLLFRMGFLMKKSLVGFCAAMLFSFSFFSIEQTTGAIGMDHNDVAFLFYVTASIWSLMEYLQNKKWYWLVAIGIFSGAAILVKWLTGLLAYACWGLFILFTKGRHLRLKDLKALFLGVAITTCVFLPWQIYIAQHFPLESSYEREFTNLHVGKAVEGHIGDFTFYFIHFNENYTLFILALLITGIFILVRSSIPNHFKTIIISGILIIYFFFSIIVSTKIIGYVFVIAPLIFLAVGFNFDLLLQLLSRKINPIFTKVIVFTLLIISCYFLLKYETLRKFHERGIAIYNYENISVKNHNTDIYRKLDTYLKGNYIIFNAKPNEQIEAMFYSDQNIYSICPDSLTINELQLQGYKIAAFTDHDDQLLPEHFNNDSEIVIIDMVLKY